MDEQLYRLHEVPDLSTPVMIVALAGWVDAGDVLETTVQAICSEPALQVAEFDADRLVDFRARRPIARIEQGINVGLTWPRIDMLATRDLDGRDVVVLRGVEPDYGWRAFCRQVMDLAQQLHVRLVVAIGGYPAATPHTRPVRLSATGTTPVVVEKVGFIDGVIEVPAGIHAAIERECAERGIPSLGLWAPVPHYAATDAYPPATIALIESLADLVDRRFPTERLADAAATTQRRLDAQLSDDEARAGLVSRLEERSDRDRAAHGDLPSGDDLAAELQRYLQDPDS